MHERIAAAKPQMPAGTQFFPAARPRRPPPRLTVTVALALFSGVIVLLWATSTARYAALTATPAFIPALGYPVMAGRGLSLIASVRSLDVRVRRLYIFDNSDGSPDIDCAVQEIRGLIAAGAVPIDNVTLLAGTPLAGGRFMGVSETWNSLMHTALLVDGAPWAMILNDDIGYPPGDLAVGAAAMWRRHHSHAAVFVDSQLPGNTKGHMFASWAISRLGFGAVGRLDENFYPAYYEDCDWFMRLRLAGVRWYVERDWHIVHPVAAWDPPLSGQFASCMRGIPGSDATAERIRMASKALVTSVVNGTVPNGNRAYYLRKWGDQECGRAAWPYPFNDIQRPLSSWTLDLGRRGNIVAGVP
jgi:hypothetical protein